jgi:hypothetical protein
MYLGSDDLIVLGFQSAFWMVGFYTGTGFLVSPDFGFSGLDSGFQKEWTWVFYRIWFFS